MSINQAAVLREGGVTRFVSSSHVFQTYGAAQGSNLSFDTLVSSASNTTAMTIASTANVGVGTSTPGSKLSVSGGVSVGEYAGSGAPANGLIVSGNVGFGTASPNALVHIEGGALVTGTLTTSNLTVLGSSTVIDNIETFSSNVIIDNQSGLGPALHVTQKGLGAQYPVADFYDFDVSTTVPAFRIADGGNVGVGTTNPASQLSVSGGVGIGTTYAGTAAPVDGLIVGGSIGVGTTSPQCSLDVLGNVRMGAEINTGYGVTTQDSVIRLGGGRTGDGHAYIDFFATNAINNNTARIIRYSGSNGMYRFTNIGTGAMSFATSNIERVRIDGTTGKFGIGTGTGTIGSLLSVSGGVGIGTTYASKAAPTDGLIVSGNVGIGTTTVDYKLQVQGDIYASGNISAGNLGMFRNRIINGDMMIDQRNAGAAVTVTTNGSRVYTLDRFHVVKIGTLTVNVQQVNTPAALTGFQKCLKFSVGTQQASLTAGDYCLLTQYIEGLNVSDLMWGTSSAQSVTVSFWIYASNTGTFSMHLRNNYGTRSYVTNYTVTSANTWQYVIATIPGDTTGTWMTDNTIGILVYLCFGTGSTYQTTADAWQAGNYLGTSSTTNFFANSVGSAVYITGLQLEKGTMATPFEFRPYGIELQLCQRYFQQLNPSVASSSSPDYYFTSTTGASLETRHPLPVAMRAAPTPSTVTTSGTASYTTYVQALRLLVDARSTTSSIQFKTLSAEL